MEMDMNKISQETLDLAKNSFTKAITTGTGIVGYSLEAPAKQLVPFLSPLRNRIPRHTSPTGTSCHWKVITNVDAAGKVTTSENNRGNAINYTSVDALAAFKVLGLQDSVTLEAIAAGRNFEDVRALSATNLLLRVMTEEEKIILGGNTTTALGTPATPTVSNNASGGAIAAGTYSIKVAALTITGANRVALNNQIASLSLPVFDGVSAISSAVSSGAITGSTNALTVSVAPKQGAFAYAWFVGTSGNETLQIVSTNSTVTLQRLVTGGTAATAVTGDTTADALAFDGIIPQIINNGGYFKDFANASITKAGGGVAELDAINSYLFQQYKLSPSRYLVSEQLAADITSAIVAGSGAPILMLNNNQKSSITGNYLATRYINKSYGGQEIVIEQHPWLPNGSMVVLTESVPYPNSNLSNLFEVECGYDYMQLEYAFANPKYEYEVRAWEALKCYFPASCAVLCNIKPGTN